MVTETEEFTNFKTEMSFKGLLMQVNLKNMRLNIKH